jgi:glycosyltransferase involved in cell wall biosynthesis
MDALVSVLIPTFNRPELIKKSINSVLLQSYKNIEIIVTDNSSDCKTAEVISSFSTLKIKYYKNVCNIGPILNWKYAYDKSSGKYWVLLPDDDYLINPFYIEDGIKIMEANNDVSVIFTDCILSYPNKKTLGLSNAFGLVETAKFRNLFWNKIQIPTIANIVRKSCVNNLDFFTNNEILYSDIELWLKLSQSTKLFYFYNEPSVNYSFGEDNIVLNMSEELLIKNSYFISNSIYDRYDRFLYCLRYYNFISSIYHFPVFRVAYGISIVNSLFKIQRYCFYIGVILLMTKRFVKKMLLNIINLGGIR